MRAKSKNEVHVPPGGRAAAAFLTIITLSLWISVAAAGATTYYSSPSGSGTTCSSTSPCSLTTGLGKLVAGDTLLLENGTYYGGITVGVSGTGSNPVTIEAENDGGAIVDGQGTARPLYISGKSYINVEGIVFRNSVYDVVDVSGGSSYINLRRLSAYNSGVGNYHLFLIYNSNHILVEDCAASQTQGSNKAGRYCFVSFSGANSNTFRRNYCKYYSHTGGGGPCAAAADYGGSYDLWENNVLDVSAMPAGCSNVNYQFAVFGEGLYYDTSHNQWIGNVLISGPNTVKAAYAESDGTISISNWELMDNVIIDGQAGIVNIGASKGAGWVVENNTVVNIPSNSMTETEGSGATATATNNSYDTGSVGLSAVSSSSITSNYNNFASVNSPYNSNILSKTGDKQVSPSYNTTTYGNGAFLMVPAALQGQGENGTDIGSEVLYEYQNGKLTNQPLWPWPMEGRISAELGVSVTYQSNGGLWKTLSGVYSSTADTTPPSVPGGLAATATSSSQINLSWTASTDNVGVAGYRVYRNGTQIATTTTASYSDTGLTASTTYSYAVSAYDSAGNTSAQSASVSATTQAAADTTPPSTPTGLTATATSSSQINLSWTASTDSVGVTGYKVYRNGSLIATTTTVSYSDTGLTASTTYSYTVSAYDSAGNTSAQSASVSATTQAAADTTPPSTPTGLTATATSSSQINLAWSASTDNTGVAGYRVYRNGSLIATTQSIIYSDTGLSASTVYTYTVSAFDAAGNVSAQSASASATTMSTSSVSASTPQVTVSATQVAPGSTVTVQVSGGNCGVQEWVALYLASNPDSSYSVNGNWQYLNGLKTQPATGLCSATLQFVMPTTPGVYNFRYFAQNGYATLLAVSPDVTVVSSGSAAPSTATTTIVDNGQAGTSYSGTWYASTMTGYYGTGSIYAYTSSTKSPTYAWNATLPKSGTYTVYAWWASNTNRSTAAPYTIKYSGGSATVKVNQQINGGQWNELGTFTFGTSGKVTLAAGGNGLVVSADAIKFVSQ